MGWICTKCRTENDFARLFCVACRFEPDEAFLKHEREASQREHASFLAESRRKEAALKRDFLALRKTMARIQAAALVVVLATSVAVTVMSGTFTTEQARQIYAADFSSHAGLTALAGRIPQGRERLQASFKLTASTAAEHGKAISAVTLPRNLQEDAAAFSASAKTLQDRTTVFSQRLEKSIDALLTTGSQPQ